MRHWSRWMPIGLVLCVVGGVGISAARHGSQGSAEPERFDGPSAYGDPTAQPVPRRLPPVEPGEHQPALYRGASYPHTREIQPASYLTAVATANAALGQQATGAVPPLMSVTDEVATAPRNLTWEITGPRQTITVRSTRVSMTIENLPAMGVRIRNQTGEMLRTSGEFATDRTNTAIDHSPIVANLGAGVNTLTVSEILAVDDPSRDEDPFLTVTVITPTPGVTRPTVTDFINNKLEVREQPLSAGVRVYGTFLRLLGTLDGFDQGGRSELEFLLFDHAGVAVRAERQPQEGRPTFDGNAWTLDLEIPQRHRQFSGKLVALHRQGDRVAFQEGEIAFTVERDRPFVPPPNIENVLLEKDDLDSKAGDSPNREASLITNPSEPFFLRVTTEIDSSADTRIILYEMRGGRRVRMGESGYVDDDSANDDGRWTIPIDPTKLSDGVHEFVATIYQGNLESEPSEPVFVHLVTKGPRIRSIDPLNLLFGPGRITLTIFFSPENPIDKKTPEELRAAFALKNSDGSAVTGARVANAVYDEVENSVTVTFADFDAEGQFMVEIKSKDKDGNKEANALVDVFDKIVEDHSPIMLIKSSIAGIPSVAPGISHTTGPYVKYHEFTKPRESTHGFNPNDKVSARVVRLYYFRDAHRVAQIVNRKVQSYNRQGVDMVRQLADKARQDAEARTRARRAAEREAIRKAQETREAERQLEAAQQQMAAAVRELNREIRTPAAGQQTNGQQGNGQQGNGQPANTGPDPRRVQSLENLIRSLAGNMDNLRGRVQQLRADEAEAAEKSAVAEAEEDAAIADQFRRERAAAHADPDTYAAGVPDSYDPVEQVSVSVIGEGLIHLRGPLKGINIIRSMIDEIDSPVGQVRVAIHTIQVNGEKADRMEVVSNRIQRYIDQARFLTLQSGEMLRRSVVQVAARKAEEARMLYPDTSQEARDQRYLYSFFGRDFIDELRTIDSEFLRTGNKCLSLHSMDTTSLSSALTLLALANNTTRQEIFMEFDGLLMGELPLAEQRNLEAGMTCADAAKWRCQQPEFCPLAQNARFESLRAFFNAEIAHADTMTPLQREFIRLAQILKSRLITELEYKQRVMERALVEDRLGNRLQELRDAAAKDKAAKEKLAAAEAALRPVRIDMKISMTLFIKKLESIANDVAVSLSNSLLASKNVGQSGGASDAGGVATSGLVQFLAEDDFPSFNRMTLRELKTDEIISWNEDPPNQDPPNGDPPAPELRGIKWEFYDFKGYKDVETRVVVRDMEELLPDKIDMTVPLDRFQLVTTVRHEGGDLSRDLGRDLNKAQNRSNTTLHEIIRLAIKVERERHQLLGKFDYERDAELQINWDRASRLQEEMEKFLRDFVDPETGDVLPHVPLPYVRIVELNELSKLHTTLQRGVMKHLEELANQMVSVWQMFSDVSADPTLIFTNWMTIRADLKRVVKDEEILKAFIKEGEDVNKKFPEYLRKREEVKDAEEEADRSRRPLDHKKFLDQLIDELEEDLIELLEGTRAHTANIDNYLKRLTTALDDDFNTQFYFPTFRFVREAATEWDVHFGQTETTSILANNRQLAKVLPGATMEFDLPARDILLAEGINGAKALIDDVGALANDPTFLAAARLQGPNSTASPAAGSTGGQPVQRSVLPGLSTDTAEQVLAQNAGGQNRFGSNLENLIPDPAIYKIETGTGYEIRPVIQPDGQAVVFDFNYMYTTNVREPVRADEKHLGRVKRHFVDTDVQLSNYELREVSRYIVGLKVARTGNGVPLLEDIPGVGVLFRPLPSQESSLQQNLIMAQATIFPTLFDLMGLRWAPVVADLDPLDLSNREFIVRGRRGYIENRVYDEASSRVDEFLRIPEALRRPDLYRTQHTIPRMHPNGYVGGGLDTRESGMQEGYQPERSHPQERFIPRHSIEGAPFRPGRSYETPRGTHVEEYPLEEVRPAPPDPQPIGNPRGPQYGVPQPGWQPGGSGSVDFPTEPMHAPMPDGRMPETFEYVPPGDGSFEVPQPSAIDYGRTSRRQRNSEQLRHVGPQPAAEATNHSVLTAESADRGWR